MSKFLDWLSDTERTAPQTAVGKMATAAGYMVAQTGGWGLCWEKPLPEGRYLWICDEGNGLGECTDEPFLVGFYDAQGETIADGTAANFAAALDWCRNAERANR